MALTEREEIVDQEEIVGDFPGGPLVRTWPTVQFKPWWESSDPTCLPAKKLNIKLKQYCNKFKKVFKYGPHEKKEDCGPSFSN